MGKFIDLTGQKFGRLTVVKKSIIDKLWLSKWLCKCDCGNETIVRGACLKNNNTVSCGCYNKEMNQDTVGRRSIVTHHMSKERPYGIWVGIIKRCNNTKSTTYKRYGGRGIKICDRWLTFEKFWEDMREGYSDTLSIDRIDNNGNYEKSNCRWATIEEQSNNKRNSVAIEYNNKKYTLKQLSQEFKIQYATLWYRLNHGWGIEKSLQIKGVI